MNVIRRVYEESSTSESACWIHSISEISSLVAERVHLWSRSREIGSSRRRQWDASFKLINSEIRERPPIDPLINKLANFILPRSSYHVIQLKYKSDRWYRWRCVFATFNIFGSFRLKIVKLIDFNFRIENRSTVTRSNLVELFFSFFFFFRNSEGFICTAEQSFYSGTLNFPRILELRSCEIITTEVKKKIPDISTSCSGIKIALEFFHF